MLASANRSRGGGFGFHHTSGSSAKPEQMVTETGQFTCQIFNLIGYRTTLPVRLVASPNVASHPKMR